MFCPARCIVCPTSRIVCPTSRMFSPTSRMFSPTNYVLADMMCFVRQTLWIFRKSCVFCSTCHARCIVLQVVCCHVLKYRKKRDTNRGHTFEYVNVNLSCASDVQYVNDDFAHYLLIICSLVDGFP